MWDTCTVYKPFWTKKFDWVARGGQGRSKSGPEMDSNQSGAVGGPFVHGWSVGGRKGPPRLRGTD